MMPEDEELDIPERTAKLDQHWEFMKSWMQNSTPECVQQVVDILNGSSVDDFLIMVNQYPQHARLMKQFALLAVYEADYRIRLQIAEQSGG